MRCFSSIFKEIGQRVLPDKRACASALLLACILALSLYAIPGCSSTEPTPGATVGESDVTDRALSPSPAPDSPDSRQDDEELLAAVPEFRGTASVELNGNTPAFTESEIARAEKGSFEEYAPLDELGRCETATACIGIDLMPTEARGDIWQIKPTGWITSEYDFIEGEKLYNRSHLIGFMLAGENANERNLITGTRYMNATGMLPFEEQVARFVETTGKHVLYRVNPIFVGDEMVARGVNMEARSIEDDGAGVSFNVFCYNVQPGVDIDYATGDNRKSDVVIDASAADDIESYTVNVNTGKFHHPNCRSVRTIAEDNREDVTCRRSELIDRGLEPCGNCKP